MAIPLAQRNNHRRTQNGRRPQPLAGQRHERRAVRQTDHRHRQLLHPVRTRPCPPPRDRPAAQEDHRRARLLRRRVQHHRHRRRHRHGPRRHALLPALARPDRRQRRIHVQRPYRRRDDLHQQLRQDHPRHADGRHAPQHPGHLRLRRTDGGRHRRRANATT